MRLVSGTRLGPYEILSPIGAGGMGEVYKALDTRLNRTVAIKISNEKFSERFGRESRAVAALNHSHICVLHDVGPNYLVMEYVEGAPLKGPITAELAVKYAAQICDALDAAHKKGITHRDLKPANILVTKAGIKLLDFGLARITSPAGDATVTQELTRPGEVMGTPYYMAPEQWNGEPGDARSDIYSFGCVLYEMLTGKRVSPDRESIEPRALEMVLRNCLAQVPDDRWQTASDVRRALELAIYQPPTLADAPKQRRSASDGRMLHFHVNAPPGAEFELGSRGGAAISPDGRAIAFVATSGGVPQLWVRLLDSVTPRALPGTDGARYPFWSPNGRSIAFFADGKLKRIDLSGGAPAAIAAAPSPRGGTWNAQGTILFAPSAIDVLQRVPASGGTPVPVTSLPGRVESHRWPHFLPDGRRFLYLIVGSKAYPAGVHVSSLNQPQENAQLIESSAPATFSPSRASRLGYVLWPSEGTLTAQPLDPEYCRLCGEPVAVPRAEAIDIHEGTRLAGFWASNNGSILLTTGSDRYQLTWYSRAGEVLSTVGRPDRYAALRISPDGSRAAVSLVDSAGKRDLWRFEFAHGEKSRLTFSGKGAIPIWSPDSRRIVYSEEPGTTLWEKSAGGTGEDVALLKSDDIIFADDFSPDRRHLMYSTLSLDTQFDLWLLPMAGDQKPVPYLKTRFSESHGQFSPDGKWIAYRSNESGRDEIYVQTFPASGTKYLVSGGGGGYPRWRVDGKELFYRALDGRLMAAPVQTTEFGLEFGAPVALFHVIEPLGQFPYPYDVSPDGQRILALAPAKDVTLTVLINWQAGLKH